jgi:hypothetical protein
MVCVSIIPFKRLQYTYLLITLLVDEALMAHPINKCEPEDVPTSMNYTAYEGLVCKWGVEIIGWTEVEIVNPGQISTALSLQRLAEAWRSGDCYWSALTQEAWDR